MQNEKENNLSGFLIINKPKNATSFDCIRYIKRILKQKIKIGHTGTLDDFATGLLIICISRQTTRRINEFMNLDKEYVVKAKLGELTDSLDYTGKIIASNPFVSFDRLRTNGISNPFTINPIEKSKRINKKSNKPFVVSLSNHTNSISKEDLQKVINEFPKSYIQVPPIYSALKHKGKPLYHFARTKKLEEKELEEIAKQKSREVTIYELELLDFEYPFFTVRTRVSKGTYIRSLANDIAQKLNIPATTYELERTKIGQISLADAVNLNDLKSVDDIKDNLKML